jgi:Cu+-exporting ATPase
VAKSNRVPNGAAHVHVTIGGVWRGYFQVRKRARAGIPTAVAQLRTRLRVALLTGDAQVDTELASFQRCSSTDQCSPVDKAQVHHRGTTERAPCLDGGRWLERCWGPCPKRCRHHRNGDHRGTDPCQRCDHGRARRSPTFQFLLAGKTRRRIVLASLGISLCYNVVGVSFAVAGQLTPLFAAILMPLSSVSVVAFVTVASLRSSRSKP